MSDDDDDAVSSPPRQTGEGMSSSREERGSYGNLDHHHSHHRRSGSSHRSYHEAGNDYHDDEASRDTYGSSHSRRRHKRKKDKKRQRERSSRRERGEDERARASSRSRSRSRSHSRQSTHHHDSTQPSEAHHQHYDQDRHEDCPASLPPPARQHPHGYPQKQPQYTEHHQRQHRQRYQEPHEGLPLRHPLHQRMPSTPHPRHHQHHAPMARDQLQQAQPIPTEQTLHQQAQSTASFSPLEQRGHPTHRARAFWEGPTAAVEASTLHAPHPKQRQIQLQQLSGPSSAPGAFIDTATPPPKAAKSHDWRGSNTGAGAGSGAVQEQWPPHQHQQRGIGNTSHAVPSSSPPPPPPPPPPPLPGRSAAAPTVPLATPHPHAPALPSSSQRQRPRESPAICQRSEEQRWPRPGEAVCVMCGRFGRYVSRQTRVRVCSIECKEKQMQRSNPQQATAAGTAAAPGQVKARAESNNGAHAHPQQRQQQQQLHEVQTRQQQRQLLSTAGNRGSSSTSSTSTSSRRRPAQPQTTSPAIPSPSSSASPPPPPLSLHAGSTGTPHLVVPPRSCTLAHATPLPSILAHDSAETEGKGGGCGVASDALPVAVCIIPMEYLFVACMHGSSITLWALLKAIGGVRAHACVPGAVALATGCSTANIAVAFDRRKGGGSDGQDDGGSSSTRRATRRMTRRRTRSTSATSSTTTAAAKNDASLEGDGGWDDVGIALFIASAKALEATATLSLSPLRNTASSWPAWDPSRRDHDGPWPHAPHITAAAFARGDNLCIGLLSNGFACIWDLSSNDLIRAVDTRTRPIAAALAMDDTALLLPATAQPQLSLLPLNTLKPRVVYADTKHRPHIVLAHPTSPSSFLIFNDDASVSVADSSTDTVVDARGEGMQRPLAAAWAGDASWVALAVRCPSHADGDGGDEEEAAAAGDVHVQLWSFEDGSRTTAGDTVAEMTKATSTGATARASRRQLMLKSQSDGGVPASSTSHVSLDATYDGRIVVVVTDTSMGVFLVDAF